MQGMRECRVCMAGAVKPKGKRKGGVCGGVGSGATFDVI